MCLSSPLSDPHQAIAFSTNPSSSRAIGFSCSKHFAVLEILISRFSLPHHRYPGTSERFSDSAMATESRYCVPLDFQVCDEKYGK